MSLLLSSKSDKWKIRKIVSVLQDELDDVSLQKSKYDYDEDFGMCISLITKSHLLKNVLEVFTIFKTQGITELPLEVKQYILARCKIIKKRLTIHTVQLRKFKAYNLEENINYFNLYLRIIYSYTLTGQFVQPNIEFRRN